MPHNNRNPAAESAREARKSDRSAGLIGSENLERIGSALACGLSLPTDSVRVHCSSAGLGGRS
jgi:hypothetical protein